MNHPANDTHECDQLGRGRSVGLFGKLMRCSQCGALDSEFIGGPYPGLDDEKHFHDQDDRAER